MPPLTPYNLGCHELIGLPVAVDSDRCDAYAHVTGRVVDETKNMLVVSDGHRQRWIPKDVAVFHFTLPDRTTCRVEGKTLLGRPEDRVKKARRT